MKKIRQLVSVIVPTYNCESYLAQAIESVLSQTYESVEIIVVDDGSTDSSAEIAKNFGLSVNYSYQTNSGSAAARNRGIELAQGFYFAFLDADDIWVENKLTLQIDALTENPELDIVFGQVKQFHSPELDDSIRARIHCPTELMPGLIPSTVVVKRDSFFLVGLFRTDLKIAEFVDWYARATELGVRTRILPDLVVNRRLHKNNIGIHDREYRADYARVLKASLDRRRLTNQLQKSTDQNSSD
jgi:glycosyltransferase involved in cell wall biosynthesis